MTSSLSAGEHSGPAAMTTWPSGIWVPRLNDLDIGAGAPQLDELGECNTVDRQGATSGNSSAMGAVEQD